MQLETLTKEQEYQLIKGEFSPEDALAIMNSLIYGKINFHTLRNFSMKERSGQVSEYSLRRIQELQNASESIKDLVKQAHEQGKNLRIHSEISIEMVDKNTENQSL